MEWIRTSSGLWCNSHQVDYIEVDQEKPYSTYSVMISFIDGSVAVWNSGFDDMQSAQLWLDTMIQKQSKHKRKNG